MQPPTAAETDRAPDVVPAIRHLVPWRIVAARVLSLGILRVEFVDGTSGEVDLGPALKDDQIRGTLFEPLLDPEFFAQARVVLGSIEWPNGADLAPDTLYDAIREYGRCVVE